MVRFEKIACWLLTSLGLALLVCSVVVVPSGSLWADGDGARPLGGAPPPCANATNCDPTGLCNNKPQPCPGPSTCMPVPLPPSVQCDQCKCDHPTPNSNCQCMPNV